MDDNQRSFKTRELERKQQQRLIKGMKTIFVHSAQLTLSVLEDLVRISNSNDQDPKL